MKWDVLLYCILTAFCFGTWPIIMKTTGLKPNLAAFILTTITMVIVSTPFIIDFHQLKIPENNLVKKALMIAIMAGLLNGVGTILFQKVIAATQDMSKAYIIILISQLPVAAISSIIFLHEPITIKKLAGFVAAIITILLLA